MPLRAELYRRLARVGFGQVRISNEGMEMKATVQHSATDGQPRLRITYEGECYCVNCPFCKDTRGRLRFNYMWGWLHPETLTRNLWLCHCYNKKCLRSDERQKMLYDEVFGNIHQFEGAVYDVAHPGQQAVPGQALVEPPGQVIKLHELNENHRANVYLRRRHFDPDLLGRSLGVGYCAKANPKFSSAQDCIVIPITFGGEYVGWQARLVGSLAQDCFPKYLSMAGMRKTDLLYNYDVAKTHPFGVVCEGCTDVWRVGPAGVALFGKTLSEMQKHYLGAAWGDGTVVVLLDGDAPIHGQRVCDALRGHVRHRVLVTLPDGTDPGDFTQAELWTMIDQAAREQNVDLHLTNRVEVGQSASG